MKIPYLNDNVTKTQFIQDFNKFIQLAQEGDSRKVDLRTNDFRKNKCEEEEDWYSVFPDEFVVFELGKLSSNNIDGRSMYYIQ